MADALPLSKSPTRDIALFERHLAGRMGAEKQRLDTLAIEAELARAPGELTGRLADLGKRMGARTPVAGLEALRQALVADEALVLLTLDAAMVIRRDRVTVSAIEPAEEEVRSNLRRLRAGLDPSGISGGEAAPVDLAAARSLWSRLFGPIEADLQGVTNVRIAAEGMLALVPFDALLTEPPAAEQWTASDAAEPAWAIRKFAFSLLPSAASFQALENLPPSKAAQTLLGLGGPALRGGGAPVSAIEGLLGEDGKIETARVQSLAPLPDTLIELKAMASAVGGGAQSSDDRSGFH